MNYEKQLISLRASINFAVLILLGYFSFTVHGPLLFLSAFMTGVWLWAVIYWLVTTAGVLAYMHKHPNYNTQIYVTLKDMHKHDACSGSMLIAYAFLFPIINPKHKLPVALGSYMLNHNDISRGVVIAIASNIEALNAFMYQYLLLALPNTHPIYIHIKTLNPKDFNFWDLFKVFGKDAFKDLNWLDYDKQTINTKWLNTGFYARKILSGDMV